jgi:copper oxidase (laccase) domain-containing protein
MMKIGFRSELVSDPKRLRVSLQSWKEKGIVHGFSTRRVLITPKDFYEKERFEAAKEFCETLKIPLGNLILPKQVHSSHIATVSDKIVGRLKLFPDCDGLMTRSKNIAIGVLSADCVPLLFYVPSSQTIAAAHAGWRGLQKELPKKMIQQLVRFAGADPTEILVAIGPCIRSCCYEVKQDVGNGKIYLDLVAQAKSQLTAKGVSLDQISDTGLCTSCRNESFFSYRLEGEKAGRTLSAISL